MGRSKRSFKNRLSVLVGCRSFGAPFLKIVLESA